MPKRAAKPKDLREACLQEALAIIESQGAEKLSLREVARRLGVSHQAPYRHFQSRDHILAEIISRGFDAFAAALQTVPRHADPSAALQAMTAAYLDFAALHPLHYRPMFGAVLPDAEAHPAMMSKARHTFTLLTDALTKLPGRGGTAAFGQVALDAVFVWAALHGLVAIRQSGAMRKLPLPAAVREGMGAHVLGRIAGALAAPH
jgi:AcrR family transcriptional regulator